MRRRPLGAAVLASLALSLGGLATAAAERPFTGTVSARGEVRQLPPNALVPYNTVYLNRCAGGGCTIRPGDSSSIADTWGVGGQRNLTAFPYGDEAWDKVVGCVRDVFSPFQVNIVTTNPGSQNHFEIMIAGAATDLNSTWTNYGGVAPGNNECDGYLHNALVFAFAKAYGNNSSNTCDDSCVNEICATAAQEIGHVWKRMDHVRTASDPMTYFGFTSRRYFQNTDAVCGSDCVNGTWNGPFGAVSCTGIGNQSHPCWCGGDTQNSHETIKSLFGLGPGTPPITKITSPKLGESVEAGFPVYTEITDDSGSILRVEFKVDGQTVTQLAQGPFVFNAPSTLAEGTHRVEIVAYDPHGTPGTATVDVVVGPPCDGEDDCAEENVCVGGRCVAGPSVTGGLGTACSSSTDCVSGQCASDGTSSVCVELCLVGQCPEDFGCLDTGSGDGTGVCWPGYDDGSGGCGCQTSRGGPAGMFLALLVMVLSCRRRRR